MGQRSKFLLGIDGSNIHHTILRVGRTRCHGLAYLQTWTPFTQTHTQW